MAVESNYWCASTLAGVGRTEQDKVARRESWGRPPRESKEMMRERKSRKEGVICKFNMLFYEKKYNWLGLYQ